ncbi:MAG: site-2 protease family protein, partial [Cephaloticoccus sp.]
MSAELFQDLLSNVWAVALVALFFGGSIFVHELGHFLAARWCGLHVERFSIGFGPAICSWRGKDGVEYRLSWLPLGGYVTLPQLAAMSEIEGESYIDVADLPPVTYGRKMFVLVAGTACNILYALALGNTTPTLLGCGWDGRLRMQGDAGVRRSRDPLPAGSGGRTEVLAGPG